MENPLTQKGWRKLHVYNGRKNQKVTPHFSWFDKEMPPMKPPFISEMNHKRKATKYSDDEWGYTVRTYTSHSMWEKWRQASDHDAS